MHIYNKYNFWRLTIDHLLFSPTGDEEKTASRGCREETERGKSALKKPLH